MPMTPFRPVKSNWAQLDKEIAKALRKVRKDTVHVNYSFGEDSTGEPSIYFRIVLKDADAKRGKIGEVTSRIRAIISDELRLYENWGLLSYFKFRSKSEQEELNDPAWA